MANFQPVFTSCGGIFKNNTIRGADAGQVLIALTYFMPFVSFSIPEH